MICINAKDYKTALLAINRYKNIKKLDIKHDANALINKFIEKHKRIEKYFCSGEGISLQYLDSRIAEDILMYFYNKDIPCLPVHDSFIVPEKYGEELCDVMKCTYSKHMNYDIEVEKKY